MHVFIATGLTPSALQQDDDEVITVEKVAAGQVLALAERGELQDAKSLVAVLLAGRRFRW
jgi:hypothetical protein